MSNERNRLTFEQLQEQYPGLEERDPASLGRFATFLVDWLTTQEDEQLPITTTHDWYFSYASTVFNNVAALVRDGNHDAEAIAEMVLRDAAHDSEEGALIETIDTVSVAEAHALVLDFFDRYGYTFQWRLGASPLFPEGRNVTMSVQKAYDTGRIRPYKNDGAIVDMRGDYVSSSLTSILLEEVVKESDDELEVWEVVESLGVVDRELLERLRTQYGAKAATLIAFASKLQELKEKIADSFYYSPQIPAFVPVAADIYTKWERRDPEFDGVVENLRIQALQLVEQDQLIVVRSSAVKSEDNETSTGAGVYASVAVDPHDVSAFRQAIETVYGSARSDTALAYQKAHGVSDEKMGLILQAYHELPQSNNRDMVYGHAASYGAHLELIDVHTQTSVVQFDRERTRGCLLKRPIFIRVAKNESPLHSHPDHNNTEGSSDNQNAMHTVAYAVLLAEQVFGCPMQVEYAGDKIVQVRPVIGELPDAAVEFPRDQPPLCTARATGAGDYVLTPLEYAGWADNSTREGYVVIPQEYAFSINGVYESLPGKGAVVVLQPSTNGHIQALCRERGLLCFYAYRSDQGRAELYATFDEAHERLPLRFVADGRDGRIYAAE